VARGPADEPKEGRRTATAGLGWALCSAVLSGCAGWNLEGAGTGNFDGVGEVNSSLAETSGVRLAHGSVSAPPGYPPL